MPGETPEPTISSSQDSTVAPPSESPASSVTPTLGEDEEGNPDDPAGKDNPSLPTTTFDKVLTYSDGSEVEVIEIDARNLSSKGVANGEKTGTPDRGRHDEGDDGSEKEVEVTGSSASMTYGTKRKQATEAFELDFESMQGKIAPGKSKTGSYGFVVPEKDRDDAQPSSPGTSTPSTSPPCSPGT